MTRVLCAMVHGAFDTINGERILCEQYLAPGAPICIGGAGAPVREENPWTEGLRGKKVLVVHPFAETIEKQYAKRELLFANPKILPEFRLSTIKTVVSLANAPCGFPDWFAALDQYESGN